jgi:hypothetical protein
MVSPNDDPNSTNRIPAEEPVAAPGEALREAIRQFSELRDYVVFYVRTRIDLLKLSLRDLVFFAAMTLTALLLGAALCVTAVVIFCRGIAEGLTILFGDRAWLGDLVTALLMFGLIIGGIFVSMNVAARTWKERTIRAYDRLKRRQRAAHGTDVDERANQ